SRSLAPEPPAYLSFWSRPIANYRRPCPSRLCRPAACPGKNPVSMPPAGPRGAFAARSTRARRVAPFLLALARRPDPGHTWRCRFATPHPERRHEPPLLRLGLLLLRDRFAARPGRDARQQGGD